MTPAVDQPLRFHIGDRVRYRFAHRDAGTIMKRAYRGGDWHIRWDHDTKYGPRLVPAYEANLEPENVPQAESIKDETSSVSRDE